MPLDESWRALHRTRFAELPLDCGANAQPGLIYSEDLRDWSDKATTPDQARIERYIDRFDLRSDRILHIGIGNSGLAKRFKARAGEIVGTTIDEPEMRVAGTLGLPNYRFLLHNKYSGGADRIPGRFDFILDNNPTSPCCCFRHLSDLFDFYVEKLAEDGQIITDRQGLEWVPEEGNPRWSFDFEDLAAVGSVVGLQAFKMNRTVYVLARSRPAPPGPAPLARHLVRRAIRLPGQIVRHGPQAAARAVRTGAKALLQATVPWALPARYRPRGNAKR
jgi:hypothetical protein